MQRLMIPNNSSFHFKSSKVIRHGDFTPVAPVALNATAAGDETNN
jgi:hypothetical protein